MRRIAVVTCYRQPDYVRAITLRTAVADLGDEAIVVKNRSRSVRRYAEVAGELWRMRRDRPDAYLVTFRAFEVVPLVLALAGGRPVVYDEFINPVEWFVEEHRRLRPGSLPARALRGAFRTMMRRCAVVLADTASHADHAAELMDLPRELWKVVPVGTDEATFRPASRKPGTPFRVLYYGSMLPLHGLDVLLEAAVLLAGRDDIAVDVVGGTDDDRARVDAAVSRGARVRYRSWVPYEELPALFAETGLAIGGPLGDTVQSRYVITGKTYQFLASGVPTLVGANLESSAFTDRSDALVVPQGDPVAVAEAARWAADHPHELAEVGRRGRELYERAFSRPRIAEALGTALAGIRVAAGRR
ncbi:glycosyltransferase [Agrococcus sp. SCSIO52902]|uniref:glycosyltransferase family protein n=1 Tax=Agrococcus sp. SCSIO52902 TaxID=2933290 RepID=UPI001FF4E5CB|nr:glycosyltransferase [Agrococcus sp. SCSIO52902]UOW01183.1 glycosyltransferase [Agrococcus sp. SCSIO52902]